MSPPLQAARVRKQQLPPTSNLQTHPYCPPWGCLQFLGLMSIDPIELEIFRHGGGTAEQKAEADIVWPLVSAKGHRLLVTLLLMNFCANEAMPIVLDKCVSLPG